MDQLSILCDCWVCFKNLESNSVDSRRAFEDSIIELLTQLKFELWDDQPNEIKTNDFTIKIVTRNKQTIDTGLLQTIVAENDLAGLASSLFRWRAEINQKQWEASHPSLLSVFEPAITIKPGRPSFTITKRNFENEI